METHSDVITAVGPPALAAGLGVPVRRVYKWRERSSIPSYAWLDVVEIAQEQKIRITVQRLAIMAATRGREWAEKSTSE